MRIMLIYSSRSKKFDRIAGAIFATLQNQGHQIQKVKTEESTRTPSLYQYDLIFVGSPVEGFWGGKFSDNLDSFIKKCSGLEGKKSAVFVYPKAIGTGKAMKRIMHRLEEKGSIVIDFRSVKNKTEAEAFATKLGKKKETF